MSDQVQRSFLGVYDKMLKTMQLDYACCARYEASGYADFAGQLYALNANMFQNAAFCDRTLTQMMLHYLMWYQDPGLQLVTGPGVAWHVRQDCRTQRLGDELWVTWAAPDAELHVGERITGINGMPLPEVRPEVERTLWTTVEPPDPEREDWSVVLAFAKHLQVRGVDGAERTVRVDARAGDVSRMARADADGGPGAAPGDGDMTGAGTIPRDGALACAVQDDASCALCMREGVCVLTLRDAGAPGFATSLAKLLPRARSAQSLVIDVRGCRGGTQQDVYPLVPLVLAPGEKAAPERLFGPAGVVVNYARHNADEKLAEIVRLRSETGESAEIAELDALEADVRSKRGRGFFRELCEPGEGFYPTNVSFESAAPAGERRRVTVLTDRFTGEAAEWLVRAARQAGFATLMGRATLGSLDNTCPRAVRLDQDFTLIVPTATYVAALSGMATLGRGIAPDEHLAWTPEQLAHDTELDLACSKVREP